MQDVMTLGDLRKLLADLAEMPDATPIATRAGFGGWKQGFEQIGKLELITYGEGPGSMTLDVTDKTFKKRKGGAPFIALAFDK